MTYEELPGGILTPPRSKSSRIKGLATYVLREFRRRGGFRNSVIIVILGICTIILFFFGNRHAGGIQRTASHLSTYVPNRLSEAFAPYRFTDDGRWDDDVNQSDDNSTDTTKPKFHLLIPARKRTVNLCKTLLSAAILNYPPPTLIEFELGEGDKREPHKERSIQHTLDFLNGKEAHDEDLILVVEEDSWLQLPAEVTISRFFHGIHDSNAALLKSHGHWKVESDTIPDSFFPPKYTQKVLFGAQKECLNAPEDPACHAVPPSPLPKDIYGFETDKHPNNKYNRPRFMAPKMAMGQVSNMRPIFQRAAELLKDAKKGTNGENLFSQIFGEQEYQRTLHDTNSKGSPSRWNSWLSAKLDGKPGPDNLTIALKSMSAIPGRNYEFGIGLDYRSSIFQVLNNSIDDVRFLKFSTPSLIISPSKDAASAFENPIHIPVDLNLAAFPFTINKIGTAIPDPPFNEIDDTLPDEYNTTWDDIKLATNVIVPGSSVPATLNFNGDDATSGLLEDWWREMWYQEHGRALLRQYMRSPDGPPAATAAADGGDRWWDLRGGKGGVWTGRGEWLEWGEVCGEGKVEGLKGGQSIEDALFADGWGVYGQEKLGGKPTFNRFGKLVGGVLEGDERGR